MGIQTSGNNNEMRMTAADMVWRPGLESWKKPRFFYKKFLSF